MNTELNVDGVNETLLFHLIVFACSMHRVFIFYGFIISTLSLTDCLAISFPADWLFTFFFKFIVAQLHCGCNDCAAFNFFYCTDC